MLTSISYDSKFTGSKQLRMDNISNVFERIKDEQLTKIGEYVYMYDSIGKFKEPLFDGFLACVALLSNEEFDKHFMYVPITYHDVPRIDKRTSGLSTQYTDGSTLTREQFPINYKNSKHIFIMGPVNQTCLNYINNITGDVILHFQGEATSDVRKTTTYPDAMDENPGIFQCSFNLWTGEELARQVRKKITHKFTVKCRTDIEQVSVIVKSNIGFPTIETALIPTIFVTMREYMVQQIILGKWYEIPFQPLYIEAIFQDMPDKDNLVSCSILLGHCTNIPFLSLIGRRVYNNASSLPMKDYDFREFMEGLNGDLQFPAIKTDALPNINFEANATMKNHAAAVKGFIEHLDHEFSYDDISELDIVDGMEDTSASERAPFFEPLFSSVGFMKLAKETAYESSVHVPIEFSYIYLFLHIVILVCISYVFL